MNKSGFDLHFVVLCQKKKKKKKEGRKKERKEGKENEKKRTKPKPKTSFGQFALAMWVSG